MGYHSGGRELCFSFAGNTIGKLHFLFAKIRTLPAGFT